MTRYQRLSRLGTVATSSVQPRVRSSVKCWHNEQS
jgi:hypothetical protein